MRVGRRAFSGRASARTIGTVRLTAAICAGAIRRLANTADAGTGRASASSTGPIRSPAGDPGAAGRAARPLEAELASGAEVVAHQRILVGAASVGRAVPARRPEGAGDRSAAPAHVGGRPLTRQRVLV